MNSNGINFLEFLPVASSEEAPSAKTGDSQVQGDFLSLFMDLVFNESANEMEVEDSQGEDTKTEGLPAEAEAEQVEDAGSGGAEPFGLLAGLMGLTNPAVTPRSVDNPISDSSLSESIQPISSQEDQAMASENALDVEAELVAEQGDESQLHQETPQTSGIPGSEHKGVQDSSLSGVPGTASDTLVDAAEKPFEESLEQMSAPRADGRSSQTSTGPVLADEALQGSAIEQDSPAEFVTDPSRDLESDVQLDERGPMSGLTQKPEDGLLDMASERRWAPTNLHRPSRAVDPAVESESFTEFVASEEGMESAGNAGQSLSGQQNHQGGAGESEHFSNPIPQTVASEDGFSLIHELRQEGPEQSGKIETAELHTGNGLDDKSLDRIFDQVVQRARYQQSGESYRLEIQLKPEHLGQLRIGTVLEDQNMKALIQAEDPAVAALIEEKMSTLMEKLEEAGIEVDSVEVQNYSADSGQRGSRDSQAASTPAPSSGEKEQQSVEDDPDRIYQDGRLHYFA